MLFCKIPPDILAVADVKHCEMILLFGNSGMHGNAVIFSCLLEWYTCNNILYHKLLHMEIAKDHSPPIMAQEIVGIPLAQHE